MERPLTGDEIRAYEDHLRSLLTSFSNLVSGVEQGSLAPSGATRYRPDDQAVESTLLDAGLAALAAEDELGYEVRDALERIESYSFGLCETCSKWIGQERLAIVPYARECATCAWARVQNGTSYPRRRA